MTLIPFTPADNATPPFQTLFQLDGATYQGVVTWNFYAQRWYLSLIDQSGQTAWHGPLIGSPLGYDMPLAPGVFQSSSLLYRADTGNFEVSP